MCMVGAWCVVGVVWGWGWIMDENEWMRGWDGMGW